MTTLGLVVATYHEPIVDRMEALATERATALAAEVADTVRVPGVYDTVLPADRLARREDIDAVAVIGTIISGETDHDQVIGHAVATQLQSVALDRDTPVTLGIAGPGMSPDVAHDRVDYGAAAVEAAVELVDELAD